MKKILLLLLLCFVNLTFSQAKKFDYKKYSFPNKTNELSLFLKENIKKKELKKVTFNQGINNVVLSFYLNERLEIFEIDVDTKNFTLNRKLENLLSKFPLEKLNIPKPSPGKKYSLQIIEKEGRKNVFNCSTKIIEESPVNCATCDQYKQFNDKNSCFIREVKNHIYNNIDFELIKNQSKKTDSLLFISFSVNPKGKLIYKKNKKDTEQISSEVKRVFTLFSTNLEPASFHQKAKSTKHSTFIYFDKKNRNNTDNKFLKYSNPNPGNKLSKYISDNLSKELLNCAELNDINKNLKVYFEISPKRELLNIRTNARNKLLENKIINLLRHYPIREFNIKDAHRLNSYSLIVLQYINANPTVSCSTNVSFYRAPIFPGCETSKNNQDSKKCFNEKISSHVNKNFNINASKNLNLKPGIKKIYATFVFDKLSLKLRSIKVKSPHPKLEEETKRVLNSMPRLTNPFISNSKPANVRYTLPIVFLLE